jgi:hypothetical protein
MAQATTVLATLSVQTDLPYSVPPIRDFEFEVLTSCCAAEWNPEHQIRFLDLLGSVSDWTRLLDAAENHGLVPLLFDQVTRCSPDIATDRFSQLRSRYQESSRRALWFSHELTRILDHLKRSGIEAIAHKGPALALALYGDVTQRQYRDLDILVRPHEVRGARMALAELNYTCSVEYSEQQERAYLDSGYEYVFDSQLAKNALELQWRVLPQFYSVNFDVNDLFERSTDTQACDAVWRVLGREDLLLVLCVHAAKHVWTQLSWPRDITQLARSDEMNWTRVWKQAEELGIHRIVALNFALANRLFQVNLPETEHADDQIAELAVEILPIIRRGVPYDTESVGYFRLMMRLRERLRDRLRFAWRLAVTPGPGEWKAVSLPRVLFPLYRIVRLGRLAKRIALPA